MNDFYFHLNTKFHYGRGVVAGIADEILNYGKRMFFIYDEIPAAATGAYDLIHQVCGEAGIAVSNFRVVDFDLTVHLTQGKIALNIVNYRLLISTDDHDGSFPQANTK